MEKRREITGKFMCVSTEFTSTSYPEDPEYAAYYLDKVNYTFVPSEGADSVYLGFERAERFGLIDQFDKYELGKVYELKVIEVIRQSTYDYKSYEAKQEA